VRCLGSPLEDLRIQATASLEKADDRLLLTIEDGEKLFHIKLHPDIALISKKNFGVFWGNLSTVCGLFRY
jgi:hypothetical protein